MIHENTFNNGCPCDECNSKSFDFDSAYDDMLWRWETLKLGSEATLKEFLQTARKIADNSEDSIEFIIGDFIVNTEKV